MIEGIFNLKTALGINISDISGVDDELAVLVDAEAGKVLSENDLTDALKDEYDAAVEHKDLVSIHVEPDLVTISNGGGVLNVIAAAILDLLSGTAPVDVDVDGKITLGFDETQFEVAAGKLTLLEIEPPACLLSFDEETSILSVDPINGSSSVDLSSLSPEAMLDLSNYLKKIGAANQTVEGDISVTGKLKNF